MNGPGRVVDVDEEAVRAIGRLQKRAHGFAQRLVVASDDQHRHCLAVVHRGADDQVPKDAVKRRPGRGDAGPGQVIAQRKRDPVAPLAVNGTLLHRHDPLRSCLIVAHAASPDRTDAAKIRTRPSAGNEWEGWTRRGLPETGSCCLRRSRPGGQLAKETAQRRLLRCQLLVIGQVQQAASATDASVPADHGSSMAGAGPRRRSGRPCVANLKFAATPSRCQRSTRRLRRHHRHHRSRACRCRRCSAPHSHR